MTKQGNHNATLKGASPWRFEGKIFLKQWQAPETTNPNYTAKGNSVTSQYIYIACQA